jgi:hypothetical protein
MRCRRRLHRSSRHHPLPGGPQRRRHARAETGTVRSLDPHEQGELDRATTLRGLADPRRRASGRRGRAAPAGASQAENGDPARTVVRWTPTAATPHDVFGELHAMPARRYSTRLPATATFRLAPWPIIGISTQMSAASTCSSGTPCHSWPVEPETAETRSFQQRLIRVTRRDPYAAITSQRASACLVGVELRPLPGNHGA